MGIELNIDPITFHRYRACVGKFKHPTRQAAEAAAELSSKQWKLNRNCERIVAYYCEFCRHFHTGGKYAD